MQGLAFTKTQNRVLYHYGLGQFLKWEEQAKIEKEQREREEKLSEGDGGARHKAWVERKVLRKPTTITCLWMCFGCSHFAFPRPV